MDYLSLGPSKGNKENILVITDHFTRYAQAFSIKTQTAHATAKINWENFSATMVFQRSLPQTRVETELIKDKIRITPYHPMTNS